MWIIKEKDPSWNGKYFRDTLFIYPKNMFSVAEVTFLHDKAQCFKALPTQELLQNIVINFFSSNKFLSGSSEHHVYNTYAVS